MKLKEPKTIILRETANYVAHTTPKGNVRIISKDTRSTPSSGIVRPSTWNQLKSMNDSEFAGSVCLEIGIGAFNKQTLTPRAPTIIEAARRLIKDVKRLEGYWNENTAQMIEELETAIKKEGRKAQ